MFFSIHLPLLVPPQVTLTQEQKLRNQTQLLNISKVLTYKLGSCQDLGSVKIHVHLGSFVQKCSIYIIAEVIHMLHVYVYIGHYPVFHQSLPPINIIFMLYSFLLVVFQNYFHGEVLHKLKICERNKSKSC